MTVLMLTTEANTILLSPLTLQHHRGRRLASPARCGARLPNNDAGDPQ